MIISIKKSIQVGALLGILFIFGCGKHPSEEAYIIHSVVDVRTSFIPSSDFNHTELDMLVNLVGAYNGFGDVTGPLWTMLDLKEILPKMRIAAIIDDYSYGLLKEMYQFNDISELDKLIGVNFISPKQARMIRSSNIILELFSGGRNNLVQRNHPFKTSNTRLIVSDTMHGFSLDYLKTQNDVQLYFNPPGVGKDRSGLINNPEINQYSNKSISERRKIAADHFSHGLVKSILNQNLFKDAKIGFMYGAHNTVRREDYLSVQTKTFLTEVKKINSPNSPLIVFTPNKFELLHELLGSSFKVWTPNELQSLSHLENRLYLLSLGPVSNIQFTGLMSSTDVPIIIEGNSAVSTALRLSIPFVMFRSPWNMPQILDINNIEKEYFDSENFGDIYGFGAIQAPEFDRFLQNITTTNRKEIYFQALSIRIPSFSKKIAYLLSLPQIISKIDEITNEKERDKRYLALSKMIGEKVKDIPLEYSILFNAKTRGLLSEAALLEKRAELKERHVDVQNLETRFIEKASLK